MASFLKTTTDWMKRRAEAKKVGRKQEASIFPRKVLENTPGFYLDPEKPQSRRQGQTDIEQPSPGLKPKLESS